MRREEAIRRIKKEYADQFNKNLNIYGVDDHSLKKYEGTEADA